MPTLVIAECLFCYLENEATEKMMDMLTGYFTGDLGLANFDMMHPKDAFGRMMQENLEKRGCKLLGIKECPDEVAQEKRMLEHGFTTAKAEPMLTIHNERLDKDELARIEKLEIFDEFEEWNMLQSHYLISIGSRLSEEKAFTFD